MRWTTLSAALLIVTTACSTDHPEATSPLAHAGALQAAIIAEADSTSLLALGATINTALSAQGAEFRVAYAEWMGSDAAGQFVFFNDRGNKQLDHDWVPGDSRRGAQDRNNIWYITDQTEGAIDGLSQAQTNAAIDRAMATWNAQSCGNAPIELRGVAPGVDLGVVEFLSGLGGLPYPVADITHAGWLPAGLLPPNVLAVTFTFVFTENGVPTDIDGDGKEDVAFREILYNDVHPWGVNDNSKVDVESIALHEAGHGLSQAHFGKAFISLSNGKLHFAPRAVMNAAYSGIQQKLTGTDRAGHCSIWGSWPQ